MIPILFLFTVPFGRLYNIYRRWKNVVDANLPTPMWQGYVSLLEGNGDIMRIYGLMVNQQFMEFSDTIFFKDK